jgi:hypothetical protein
MGRMIRADTVRGFGAAGASDAFRCFLACEIFVPFCIEAQNFHNKNPELIGVFRSVVREMSMVRPFADVCAGLRILANRPSHRHFRGTRLRILAPDCALMDFLSPNYAQLELPSLSSLDRGELRVMPFRDQS